jgi:hypothetical protein
MKNYVELPEDLKQELLQMTPTLLLETFPRVQPMSGKVFKAAHEILGLPPIEPKIILDSSDPENVARLKSEGFIPLEELHYEEDSGKKEESGRTDD